MSWIFKDNQEKQHKIITDLRVDNKKGRTKLHGVREEPKDDWLDFIN